MRERLPEWLKRGIVNTESTRFVRKILKENNLYTVCDSARCPNKNECYTKNTATFMILGNICTRNCRFCSVPGGNPLPVFKDEPALIAESVRKLNLDYVVITSVTRDDLPDEGAFHFAETIREIKKLGNNVKVEVLTPDFNGNIDLINLVVEASPNVFNHNIETVKRLYTKVRPQAIYERSLELLKHVKSVNPNIYTKSGIMVGLGENYEDIAETIKDLKNNNCDIVTIGQYIQPTKDHLSVSKYYSPDEFNQLKQMAREIGIRSPIAGPLVRSSYKAKECIKELD